MTGPREVELLYGEAYFEVRPSSDTNSSPFRVIGQEQTIEVLGTAFNIQNYQNEPLTTTTLVEGKIKIATADGAVQLAPQQQLVFEKTSGASITKKTLDISNLQKVLIILSLIEMCKNWASQTTIQNYWTFV
jgi:transmembrane sensor